MPDLILVPTPLELTKIVDRLAGGGPADPAFQLCGFGPITAAARATALIARFQPERVVLVGIAGSYDPDRCAIGAAGRFDRVSCYGVGVGSRETYQGASQLGWAQFPGGDDQPQIDDTIVLESAYVDGIPCVGELLTGCSASDDAIEAQRRLDRFPRAVAEDMEGFGVAVACQLARVPLQIVRGFSNRVGDRNHKHWRIDDALAAATDLVQRLLPREWMPTQN